MSLSDIEVKDTVILITLMFFLFSMAIFWKLYFFKPPIKSEAEFELQHKSHAVSNQASQLQSAAKNVEVNRETLNKLVDAMQARERDRHRDFR